MVQKRRFYGSPVENGGWVAYWGGVSKLMDNIRESAERRLVLPAGRKPSQELSRYKEYLKHETNRLKHLHRGGVGGREICEARALGLDLLIRHLLDSVMADLPPGEGPESPRFALVATGGYGRGELNPCSDIDLMFLHNLDSGALARGRVHPWLSSLIDGLLYTLFDVGMKVGYAVRSVEDCVTVANGDMQSKTSLLEARFIAGDAELFERMQAVFLARCVRGQEAGYLEARITDQGVRRTKHGDSATMQEPNIKNGCGGLRDYQNLLWMAFFKYRTRTLEEMQERELINSVERRELGEAYDFLLRVRNELHYELNRAADIVLRPLQPRLAHNLGYTQRSPVRRLEEFMRDLYIHMRNVYLITRTLEQRLALLPDPMRRVPSLKQLIKRGKERIRRQVMDGFEFADGEVRALSRRVFRDQPRRLLRVFLYAQQRGLRLHPDLTQLIRQQLNLVDDEFRADTGAREAFLEILDQRGNVAPALRGMHETGLLGRYVPEFEPLTCLVQHEFYHQYATDEHTLQCLEHLDHVWEAEEPPHRHYTETFQSLERPYVLYLALLLHDVGKARRDGDHCVSGAKMARAVAKRLELDDSTTEALDLLIRQHLLMSRISQRRDLEDASVIKNFAAEVGSLEHLKMLTLHTLADSLGTSDQLWNGFKDSLLLQLYRKAQDHMEGTSEYLSAETRRREVLAEEVREILGGGVTEEELQAHFELLPARYFEVHEAPAIERDLRLVRRFLKIQFGPDKDALEPAVAWLNEPDRGCATLRVCTWDRPGLFGKITGALTAAGLNILDAQIFTRMDSIIIDTFAVVVARTGKLPNKEERQAFEGLMLRALGWEAGKLDLGTQIIKRQSQPKLYYSVEGARVPTTVRFDHESSDYFTVIDLEAEDHVGLLYAVTRVLSNLQLDISVARINTERGAAIDTFYVTEMDGKKVTSPEREQEIAEALTQAIASLDEQTVPA